MPALWDVNSLPTIAGELMPRLLGEKLRHLRLQRNMSQADLARQLGLARQAFISNLESGRKYPSLKTIVKMSELFGISTDYLLKDGIPLEAAEDHDTSISRAEGKIRKPRQPLDRSR